MLIMPNQGYCYSHLLKLKFQLMKYVVFLVTEFEF